MSTTPASTNSSARVGMIGMKNNAVVLIWSDFYLACDSKEL
jgi:hypothetical protein